MDSLAELLASARGAALLEERGVLTDASAFAERLRPPARTELADLLGVPSDRHLVYVGQQVCADLSFATAAKFAAARELAIDFDVTPAILWHDMDSTRSERYGARMVLPTAKRLHGIWLVPRQSTDVEPRFVAVERAALEAAFADLSTWAENARPGDREAARAQVSRLAAVALADDLTTLAQVTRGIATTLLREELGLEAPAVSASEMVAAGLLVDAVEEYLANLDDVVRVFNDAVAELLAEGVDPLVRPLPPDYLPLRFSCPRDDTRLRLARERRGQDIFATATCHCGESYAFHLGGRRATLGELTETGRWSIDVSMPIHHNHLASGWIAGRSTALYGLVFNEVLIRVLGRMPIPVFAPLELTDAAARDGSAETLLVRHLLSASAARQ
jgi:hypothetical protein